jgi:hypothetical protein
MKTLITTKNNQMNNQIDTLKKIRDCAERDLGMSVRSKQIDDGRDRIENLSVKNEVLERMIIEWESYVSYYDEESIYLNTITEELRKRENE